ncbi:hypothetical protein CONLIGDRAFT_707535 [Coniochaeta ligniaria NRRL 30616]|uniref:Uncharacterized protein n=1 Tax=Coniochaeta ligniaria NRRL 30616 TaxID=1408157 RepID=A0A1J7JH16_9PEZI|nr:hypothetical protein CONLIGDRAFT_707535 [Coniochaeta ligniaria NRRL 30616]
MPTCEPLEGNPDFYGLGIRIGIYLQWWSAWLSLLLDPESAQSVLDANSVSLFAVTIATIIAARRNAPAIEMYIMLQILIGFPVTTLSSFGLRLWLMSPRRLDKLKDELKRLWREDREKRKETARRTEERKREHRQELQQRRDHRRTSKQNGRFVNLMLDWLDVFVHADRLRTQPDSQAQPQPGPQPQPPKTAGGSGAAMDVVYLLWHLPIVLPLQVLSSLKFPGLSWSGVQWRTTTVALLAAYNMVYWFDAGEHGVKQPPSLGCGPPTIFMFSIQLLAGPIVTLGCISAVFIAVIVGPPTLTLLMLALRVLLYAIVFIARDMYFIVTSADPQSFKTILDKVNNVLSHKTLRVTSMLEIYSPIVPILPFMNITGRSLLDLLEFMSSYGADNSIRFSDVIKVGVSLGMGRPVKRQSEARDDNPHISRAQTMPLDWTRFGGSPNRQLITRLCVAWNIWMVLSIIWFITSIETTIWWNNIQGVHTIDSTGQLIPFIIGCVSASQVVKKLILLALGKKYPDWADTELEIQDGPSGPLIWKIVRRGHGDINPTGGATAGNTEVHAAAINGP